MPDDLGLQLREPATGREVQLSESLFPDSVGSVQLPNEKLTVGEDSYGTDFDVYRFERPVAGYQQGLVLRHVAGLGGQVLRDFLHEFVRIGVPDYDAGATPAKLTRSVYSDFQVHVKRPPGSFTTEITEVLDA